MGRPKDNLAGLLSCLARDVRANTLAIMAAAMIPLIGMIGGAIDLSRMYIVKTRLQHACDAGALAGRKAMGGGTWSQSSYYPRTAAQRFFDANISEAAYGADAVDRRFTENAGKVTGTATASVPMTLMRVFGFTSRTLSVVCDADMRLPNTDVMFVLDTTGSMASYIGGVRKIDALRVSVKCFYEIVARLDTDAVCTTGTPSGGTGNQVQIRFGFVPYAVNVNVGRLLQPAWMADRWTYQSRTLLPGGYGQWNGWSTSWRPARWEYRAVEHNVAGLKNGSGWNASLSLPIGNNATAKTIPWPGCIEERRTVQSSPFTSITSSAFDLDIDMVPTADPATQWKPWLPGALYTRQSAYTNDTGSWTRATVQTDLSTNYANAAYTSCPTEAKKLQQWESAWVFDNYVDSLKVEGNTYHDIGLLWGARLLSPTGIFGSENARTPEGGEIERHLIFMTDGDTQATPSDYSAYGVPWFDRRQTPDSVAPTDAMLEGQINARFAALCTAIKNKNITLWVISFGSMTTETKTRLQTCATSGRYFSANDATSLQMTFKSIADQISQLRLTR